MKILFYSPLKSPNHPIPSGDRLMARLIIRALGLLGHNVAVASEMRSFMRSSDMDGLLIENMTAADEEIERIAAESEVSGRPDLWFTYHPYYKAPDLLGPKMARRFGIPLINAEASYSTRRNIGTWQQSQDMLLQSLETAAVNLCFTRRDLDGLQAAASGARLELIQPFIDSAPYRARSRSPEPMRLVTVAMMRPGDKLSSYKALADSLKLIADLPWTLSIGGDGECRPEVEAAFASFGPGRIEWLGALSEDAVGDLLSRGSVFVWPGHGEAYGLAYLEAQAMGLPVVAEAIAGVPEVVEHDRTGLLTPAGDRDAFAEAIASLLTDEPLRSRLGQQARHFATEERSIVGAAEAMRQILDRYVR
ncbi:glycosyltransferase family 4 protein [Aliirhizobium terrae]|uniref:glycosyltransferase family 4 protein n=1 Tax=Terrirhizobium terrae TaxID=2926709 RepID=UPI002574B869|nr:glycosyltransferase family 4 protein [Rhizobium sp. CC-CFT758]WJH41858.1 glycosyltransferase family 4 protein [Rhizobium sp. CC-CFT758]